MALRTVSTLSLTLFLAMASLMATGRVQSDETEDANAFVHFVDRNRPAVAIGMLNVARKLQSRIEQFQFPGIPPGTVVDFSLNPLDESPMLSVSLSADTGSLAAGQTPMTCYHLLNLMRYLLADQNSTYYAQSIKDHKLSLDRLDPSIGRRACNAVTLDMMSVLDRAAFRETATIEVKRNLCRDEIMLEAIVGDSENDVVRCKGALRPAS